MTRKVAKEIEKFFLNVDKEYFENYKMELVKRALKEDRCDNDVTTEAIVPETAVIKAEIIAKEEGVIVGLNIAELVFRELDKEIVFEKKVGEGERVRKGKVIAYLKGKAKAVLTGERTALNLVQRLSGIATLTAEFVRLGKGIKILDTRKTIPGMRELEKYAVKLGGGCNHRFNLNDAVLIKDNHIAIAGSVKKAIRLAKKTGKKIEVEVKNLKEVREALAERVNRILLDNMKISEIIKSIKLIRENGKAEIEVSGRVNLKTIKEIAGTGADYASVGALTHSAKALDISLEVLTR